MTTSIRVLILSFNTPRPPMSVRKKFRPIGPTVWPAIRNIYINVLFYHIDEFLPISTLAYSTALSFSNSEV